MLDYYETSHYIFVHGWIPCTVKGGLFDPVEYIYNSNWRDADKVVWNQARWQNGMQAAHNHVVEPGKKIVCGHWHCSFGHTHYENKGGEFENDPDLVLTMARALLHWMPALHFQKSELYCYR